MAERHGTAGRRFRRAVLDGWPRAAVFLLTATLYTAGALEFLENRFADLTFRLLDRQATGEVVVIAIDEPSIRELNVWPWPRRYHAALIDRLNRAGARIIALDLDLSSPSNPADDDHLAKAIMNAEGRVILPAFKQIHRTPSGEMVFLQTLPTAELREHAGVALVNVRPEQDGLVRRIGLRETWGSGMLPTLPRVLTGRNAGGADEFDIDFGIRPGTIPVFSYADVLSGKIDDKEISGKIVIIGATAISLGDVVAVPLHAALPGPVVQALAAESLLQDRAIVRAGRIPVLAFALLVAILGGVRVERRSLSRSLGVTAAVGFAIAGVSILLQGTMPIILDPTPALVVLSVGYGASLAQHIDRQGMQLLLERMLLNQTRSMYKLVTHNSFDGMVTIDQSGEVLSLNPSAESILGFLADDAVGLNWRALLDSVEENDSSSPVPDTGSYQAEGHPRNGIPSLLDLSVSRTELNGQHLTVMLVRDVTEGQAAREAARKAEALLAEAVESVRAGFALFDADDRLVLLNSRFRELHPGMNDELNPGLSYEQFLRSCVERKIYAMPTTDAEGWIRQRLENHRDAGEPYEVALEDGSWHLVSERHTRDRGTVVLHTDISDIRRREQEISYLAAKYSQVAAGINATTTGVAISSLVDPGHPVVFINPAFTEITGYEDADVLGREINFLDGPETDVEAATALRHGMTSGAPTSIEILSYRKDGSVFWNQAELTPILNTDGDPNFMVWIINDITEKKQNEIGLIAAKEDAERANRMKSEFLAAMSHELRTPLNAVIGFSEVMQKEALGPLGNPQYRDFVRDIHASGSHLLAIINDILDMAKIESGRFDLSEDEVSIADIVEVAIRMVSERAETGQVALKADVPEDLPGLHADERVVRQIVVNLLSNAVKFTPEGGSVCVAASRGVDGGLTITVEDTGIGMNDEEVKIALQPFAQIDSSLSRRYEGTGLGLPLSKQFIEMHGGSMRVDSKPGQGSTVTLCFPPERTVERETTETPADEPGGP